MILPAMFHRKKDGKQRIFEKIRKKSEKDEKKGLTRGERFGNMDKLSGERGGGEGRKNPSRKKPEKKEKRG